MAKGSASQSLLERSRSQAVDCTATATGTGTELTATAGQICIDLYKDILFTINIDTVFRKQYHVLHVYNYLSSVSMRTLCIVG